MKGPTRSSLESSVVAGARSLSRECRWDEAAASCLSSLLFHGVIFSFAWIPRSTISFLCSGLVCNWAPELTVTLLTAAARIPPLMEMHMHRIAYFLRAMRLKVNVLLLDTDVLIFKDPYRQARIIRG